MKKKGTLYMRKGVSLTIANLLVIGLGDPAGIMVESKVGEGS